MVGVGDFASVHPGLTETIEALRAIEVPAVLVPGNNETEDALREAAQAGSGRGPARRGHGDRRRRVLRARRGRPGDPLGLELRPHRGGGRPAARGMSRGLRARGPLPPARPRRRQRHGKHLGSEAVLRAIESRRPRLALCGHIHESWGKESRIGPTRVINLGPGGHCSRSSNRSSRHGAAVLDHGHRGVAAVEGDHRAGGMGGRTAEVQPLDRRPVVEAAVPHLLRKASPWKM